ncbi:hypothetical protein GYMLUDRAFT_245762 [Collybiopsis luxurians FD-317 M1]|uniref:Uncharacterized protein n=1 Tax=Collybiopsis luxurians FD-317 M1 TaxID=944289 RepID=A0A0D0CTF3_9AGAR|nr:hypothetical protein GYMLUDRAFT_245762 [Collybiopsis luxurians FD-317 M1]
MESSFLAPPAASAALASPAWRTRIELKLDALDARIMFLKPYPNTDEPLESTLTTSSSYLDRDSSTPPLSLLLFDPSSPDLDSSFLAPPAASAALASPLWRTKFELNLNALDARTMFLHGASYDYDHDSEVDFVHLAPMNTTNNQRYYMSRERGSDPAQRSLTSRLVTTDDGSSDWTSNSFALKSTFLLELSDDEDDEADELTNTSDKTSFSTSSSDWAEEEPDSESGAMDLLFL